MSLMNYQLYTTVTHHDVISHVKTFALAQGWTIAEYQADKIWEDQGGGTYGWSPGSEYFLAMQSAGYGSQTLHFRLRSQAESTDANHEWIDFGCNKSGETSINTADLTHPVFQNNLKLSTSQAASFKPTNITKLWIFGDIKHIIVIAQFDANFVQMLTFGTTELFDTSEAEGAWCGHPSDNTNPAQSKWYEYDNYPTVYLCPYDGAESVLYDGVLKESTAYANNCYTNKENEALGEYTRLSRAVRNNNYSGRRMLVKPTVWLQRDIDSVFFPIGQLPIYRVFHPGLTIGEEIQFGTEKYLCFPPMRLDVRQIGVAVRIA